MLTFKRRYTVLFHLCIWSVLILCVIMWRPRGGEGHEGPMTTLKVIWSAIPFIVLFYLHAFWLIPTYLSRKRRTVYILSALVLLLGASLLSGLSFYTSLQMPAGAHYYQFVIRRIFPGLFFLMASASLGAFRENSRLEKNRKEKETEHLRTELSFLRAQVNPHFMLNVLNSMALLARRKSDLLEPALMELAGLMNYMLYDANNEKIRLEDEISYLQAYIDLQMLRFRDDVTVEFNTPQQIKNKFIEPMLLIPLVENAFKHGIGLVKSPAIFIDIEVAKEEGRLSMIVENKYNPLIQRQENKPPGIGLKNLKKRLELIYPGQFELNAIDNHHADSMAIENTFVIKLNIPLQ
jgi:two-component system LytT family sensor kinase